MQHSSKSVFKKNIYLYFYLERMQTLQSKKKKKNCIHKKYVSNAEPILDFWGPYAKLCRGGGMISFNEWMKRIWPCFVFALAESYFFGLKQETLRHSRYIIWLFFM